MARKHGFKGTPLRPPRSPGTIGRVFEQRGDPMVSAREGREKFGRNLETEDPDFDRYFAERRMEEKRFEILASNLLKPSQVEKGKGFRKSIARHQHDPQRAAANIVMKMQREMNKSLVKVKKNPGKPYRVKGNFYYFPDQKEKLANCPKKEPRPFIGKEPNKKTEK